jgi:hypothetical protein
VASWAGVVGQRHQCTGEDDGSNEDRHNGGGKRGQAERKDQAIDVAPKCLRESRRRTAGATNAFNSSKTGKKGDLNNSPDQLLSHDTNKHDHNNRDHYVSPKAAKNLKCKKSKNAPMNVLSSWCAYFARGKLGL